MKWKVGDKASLARAVTDEVVRQFADAVGDHNPIHLDEDAGKSSVFGRRVAHGMITASLVSAVIGTEMPGPGSIYMSQTFQFVAPVLVGDEITAEVKIVDIREDKPIFKLDTTVRKQDGQIVLSGAAMILFQERKGD
jgi:3-hydroxybutyryl-CoA dehydratase